MLAEAVIGATPLVATDHLGVVHRMWPVTNVGVINAVADSAAGHARSLSPTATTAMKRPTPIAIGLRIRANTAANPTRRISC